MNTPYENGFISFFLGRALEENPYLKIDRDNRRELHSVQYRQLDDMDEEITEWERGWKKASEYSKNNRFPKIMEQMSLN